MSSTMTGTEKSWYWFRSFAVAACAVTLATLARLSLDPWLGDRQAFLTYLAAVIALVFFGEILASFFVSVAGVPFAAWFFLEPRLTFTIVDMSEKVAFTAYLALSLPIVVLGAMYWRSRTKIKESEERCDFQFKAMTGERERLQRELGSLQQDLHSLDERRGDFLGLLASELRRPLAPLVSAASFHRVAATASEMESAMAIVSQETAQLGRVIEDLLDAFQQGRGSYHVQKERIDLGKIVAGVLDFIRPFAAQSGRTLTVSVAKEPVWIDGDVAQLERLIHNLLMNAVRSTSPAEEIYVTVHDREGEALVKVRDTGIGLPPHEISRIFQIDKLLASERRWMSLGLSAAKPIVDMHGGTITVHSDGEGQGCEFVVRFPLHRAPQASVSWADAPKSETA